MPNPEWKPQRLPDFSYTGPYVYFVTLCLQNRSALFGQVIPLHEGAGVRLKGPGQMASLWLSKLEEKYPGVTLVESVVMPDHVHLVLQGAGSETDLRRMMQWFKTHTTNAYIRKVREGEFPPFEGHLWQRSYYEHIIRNEEDLRGTCEYVQNNPLRWILKHNR